MPSISLAFIIGGLCLIGTSSALLCRLEKSARGFGGRINETREHGVATCPGFDLLARCVHAECSAGTRWLGFPAVRFTAKDCLPAGQLPVQALFCAQMQKACEKEIGREIEQKLGMFSGLAQVRMDKCELCSGDMCNN